jgi:hypothetical protein
VDQALDLRRVRVGEVERRAVKIHDPAAKLRFLRESFKAKPRRRRAGALSTAIVALAAAGLCLAPASARRNEPARSAPPARPVAATERPATVWLVEKSGQVELYSNGLRIHDDFRTENSPRSYRVLARGSGQLSPARSAPVGIVFHTTESEIQPFDAAHNADLQRSGAGLLEYVRRNRSYNFVVDRFGRVFRIVQETDAAHHAGHSIWADEGSVYLGLNQSFFGVSFEARSQEPGGVITAAQRDGGRLLVEALRARYGIHAINCVTHAQVSVNPGNMRIGYHTDWAAGFPFEAVGLEDAYSRPVAAVALFGFEYETGLIRSAGGQVWNGLVAAEELLIRQAAARGVPPAAHRKSLQRTYRQMIAELRAGVAREGNHGEL